MIEKPIYIYIYIYAVIHLQNYAISFTSAREDQPKVEILPNIDDDISFDFEFFFSKCIIYY